jgi:predicted TIM-barrel fold metal-dependent hydrolase
VKPSSDLYGGKGRDKWVPFGQSIEGTAGTGAPEQRVQEQDKDGVSAEILFPGQQTGPRLWRSIPDDEAYKAVVQGYNTWLAEEYCSAAPERLIGVPVMPWTNVDDMLEELERSAKRGFKMVGLGAFPSGKSYPTPDDDRFWAAAVAMNMPVTIHVELDRNGPRSGPVFKYPTQPPGVGEGPQGIVGQVSNDKFCRLGGVNAVQLIFAGVFDRFPTLRIFFAENQIGWVPFFMEQADERYERHWWWAQNLLGVKRLERPPSEYVREHCYWGFQGDRVGIELREHIGVDRAIWASDFPHQESNWPESRKLIERIFAGVPEQEQYRMVCGNAVEFFHLEDYVPLWEAARENRS